MQNVRACFLAISALISTASFAERYHCEFTAKALQTIDLMPVSKPFTETQTAVQFKIASVVSGEEFGGCQVMVDRLVWLELEKNSKIDAERTVRLSLDGNQVTTPSGEKELLNWEVVKDFLYFGKGGQTWFTNEVTVYKPRAQPRCLNCNLVKVIYDANSRVEGHLNVEKIDFESTSEFCTTRVSDLTSRMVDSETVASPTEFSFTFSYSGTESACGNTTFLLKTYAKKCLNPSEPTCAELEVRDTFSFKGDDFYNLDLYLGHSYPNLRSE